MDEKKGVLGGTQTEIRKVGERSREGKRKREREKVGRTLLGMAMENPRER